MSNDILTTNDIELRMENNKDCKKDLDSYLQPFKVNNKIDYDRTAVGINDQNGPQYAIPLENIPEFFKLYELCRIRGTVMCMSERQQYKLSDDDIKFLNDNNIDIYNKKTINDNPENKDPVSDEDKKLISDDSMSKDSVSKDSVSKDSVSEDSVSEEDKKKVDVFQLEEEEYTRSGIMIDFDIYQESEISQISEELKEELIQIVFEELTEILSGLGNNETTPHYVAFIRRPTVIQHSLPKLGTCWKDGFHMLIPSIKVSKTVKIYLHSILQERILTERIPIKVLTKIEEIVDPNSATVDVMLFGSKVNKPNKEIYYLDSLYKIEFRGTTKMIKPRWQISHELDQIPYTKEDEKIIEHNKKLMTRNIKDIVYPKYRYNLSYELSLHYQDRLIKKREYKIVSDMEIRNKIEIKVRRYGKGNMIRENLDIDFRLKELENNNPLATEVKILLDIIGPYRQDYILSS